MTKPPLGLLLLALLSGCETWSFVGSTLGNIYVDPAGHVIAVEHCSLIQHTQGKRTWITQTLCSYDPAGESVSRAPEEALGPPGKPWVRYAAHRHMVFVFAKQPRRLRLIVSAYDDPSKLAGADRILTPAECAADEVCDSLATADWNRDPWWNRAPK